MSDQQTIALALQNFGISAPVRLVQHLSGGCIHTVVAVTLADNTSVVAKINESSSLPMFKEEIRSLDSIHRTGTVLTPRPIGAGVFAERAVLLMSHLRSPATRSSAEHWTQFGRELAALHLTESSKRYGFDQDNHIGSTLQPNSWHDDWVEFNAINRLGFQIALASDNGRIDPHEASALDSIVGQLERYIPRHPQPSLLHGDLWSGNVLLCIDQAGQTRLAMIDPASSIGDGWADIAMMRLFGGFSAACFDAYNEVIKPPDDLDSRLAVYTLYHLLNHVNIFGRGYIDQAMAIAKRLAH